MRSPWFRQKTATFDPGFSFSKGLTICKKYAKFFVQSAVTKTRFSGKIPREDAALVQGICTPAGEDTTSEPQGRNALPGAPVKASMSGSESGATRVEPWNTFVSHP